MLVNEVLGLSHYKTHANELDWRVVVGFGHSIGVSASGRGSWDPSWRCRKGNLPPDRLIEKYFPRKLITRPV
jgi:hypothetical protein